MLDLPHADVVGSLIRPLELLAARENLAAGRIAPPEFKRVEDAAVDQAVAAQEEAGLEIVTDGEMRRLSFQSQMPRRRSRVSASSTSTRSYGAIGGAASESGTCVRSAPRASASSASSGASVICRPRSSPTCAAGRRSIAKVTLPSPSLFANFWSPARSTEAYPTLDAFLADVAGIVREEIEELIRLGATYIQLDAPHYPLVLDPAWAAFYSAQGRTAEDWIAQGVELDNAVMEGFPQATFAFHL